MFDRYNYQYAFGRESFPLVHLNPKFDMYAWPQAFCAYSDDLHSTTSWCIPGSEGAAFKHNATIYMKTAKGLPVVYTTDGTDPTPSSPVATGPVSITETTTFKVQLADFGSAHGNSPTTAVFVKVA
jgi:nicotinamidase-related amidase